MSISHASFTGIWKLCFGCAEFTFIRVIYVWSPISWATKYLFIYFPSLCFLSLDLPDWSLHAAYCFVMLSHAGWWNGTINMYSYVIFCTDLASGSVWIFMASAKALKSNRNTRRTNPLLQEVPTQQAWSLWTTKFCGLSIQSKKDYNSPLHFEQQCKSLQDSLKKTWTESLQELSWRHFEQQCS